MGTRASVGTVIEGKYRLEQELGAGGMGSVWLATQLMVDRNVAVKLLHPAFIDQEDLQARFEVEAKAIGRLHHPNCITLYDFGFSEELQAFYTVIEYIDGVSLDKRLDANLSLREILSIIRQVALALDHAHHQGILHRDLKPENIMLAQMTDGSEIVKVLDFGIARIVKGDAGEIPEESNRITKAGEVFGTPAYMSPEQARSIRQLKPTADLYSLGVLFYELVAGKLPFFAQSAFDLLMLHVTKPVPPIERNDVPDPLKEAIYRLLEKDPSRRFQSGRELVEALDAMEIPDGPRAPADEQSPFDTGPTRITIPPSMPVPGDQSGPRPTITTPPEDPSRNEPTMLVSESSRSVDDEVAFGSPSFQRRRFAAAGVALLVLAALGVVLFLALIEEDGADALASEDQISAAQAAPAASADELEEPAAEDEEAPDAMDFGEPTSEVAERTVDDTPELEAKAPAKPETPRAEKSEKADRPEKKDAEAAAEEPAPAASAKTSRPRKERRTPRRNRSTSKGDDDQRPASIPKLGIDEDAKKLDKVPKLSFD